MSSVRKTYYTKVDTSKYEKFYKSFLQYHKSECRKILGGAAATYAQWASIYVPPRIGEKTIPKDYYYRQLVYLPRRVKKDYPAKEKQADINALRLGYRFKIRHWLHRRKYKDKYFRKITGKAKAQLKIIYRGLLRVSFAMDLVNIGEKYPTNIKRLLSKSPKLKKFMKFNKINFSDNDSKVTIINDSYLAYSGDSFAKIAVRQGESRAEKYIKRKYKELMKANITL